MQQAQQCHHTQNHTNGDIISAVQRSSFPFKFTEIDVDINKKAFLQRFKYHALSLHFPFLLLVCSLQAQQVKGPFTKTDLFTLSREELIDGGIFTYRIAVDAEETIAFNSCNQPIVFLISQQGKILDEIKTSL